MHFRYVVEVDVERTQGKFATREELSGQILEAIEGADPGSLEGENGGEYEVQDFSVSEEEEPKPRKAEALTDLLLFQARAQKIAESIGRMARAGALPVNLEDVLWPESSRG